MGTFSKSLASCGGFIAGSTEVIDYLRIAARAVPVHRVRRAGGRRGRAGGREDLPFSPKEQAFSPAFSTMRPTSIEGCTISDSGSSIRFPSLVEAL